MNAPRTASFDRLHPSLQYVIATNLGWRELRAVQRDAIAPILDGSTTVILAPTAGGKTEAAIFPLFSRILDERWLPTSVFYVAPLRALLNDLGERIGGLTGHLGLSAAVWHGDVGQSARRRIAAAPPDLLLTTPESLEVLLSFAGDDRRALLGTVRAVVIDEAHAFYGIDRGTHLLALVERLVAWAEHDVQRIALSATIGNPDDLLSWLSGSSTRAKTLVRVAPSLERVEEFEVSYRSSLPGVVAEIQRFGGEKIIAFCRTRSDVEELAHALSGKGVPSWPHHSALSRESREVAEAAFRAAPHGVLVATSTLELGIDIGDLDRVVQIDAPTTVASLLQRLGRTGRRGGAARMTFVPTNPEQFVLVAALLLLHRDHWVEPLTPPWRPFPILAQQALATVLQTKGIAQSLLIERLAHNAAFSRITTSEIQSLIEHLLDTDILTLTDGTISFGQTGERRFGYRSFMDLASVFRTSQSVTVIHAGRDIGTLDRWFIEEMSARDRSTFLLNGQAWNVVAWPGQDAILGVTPASSAEAPLFLGGGLILSYEVMQAVRRILASDAPFSELAPKVTVVSDDSEAVLTTMREDGHAQGLTSMTNPVVQTQNVLQWFTYAGLRANSLLADLIFHPRQLPVTVSNTSLKIKATISDLTAPSDILKQLSNGSELARQTNTLIVTNIDAKFQDILPVDQSLAFAQERAYDPAAAIIIAQRGVRFLVQG